MYKVITYRSRPLKVSTFPIDDDVATDISVADFDEKENKKKKRRKKEEKIYIIDGVEVSEEDLTPDERLDMEANALLNSDGFYNPLLPLDYFDIPDNTKQNKSNKLMIAVVIVTTVLLLAGLAVAVILLK